MVKIESLNEFKCLNLLSYKRNILSDIKKDNHKNILRKYFDELIFTWDNSTINKYDFYEIYIIVKYINIERLTILYNELFNQWKNKITTRSVFYPIDNYLLE